MFDKVKHTLDLFKPRFNELNTYIIALTCFVLFVSHPEFRQIYGEILSGSDAGKASASLMALGLIWLFGFFLSFIHIFVKRPKSYIEKMCMSAFAFGANGLAGIAAGIEMLPAQRSILMVFPVWNILMGLISLYQIGLVKDAVTDDESTFMEVIIASIILLVVFAIAEFGFHFSWAMTFSLCMFFSSTITFFLTWSIGYWNARQQSVE
jgi:hypothetical protein